MHAIPCLRYSFPMEYELQQRIVKKSWHDQYKGCIDGPSGHERCLGSVFMIIITNQPIGGEKQSFDNIFKDLARCCWTPYHPAAVLWWGRPMQMSVITALSQTTYCAARKINSKKHLWILAVFFFCISYVFSTPFGVLDVLDVLDMSETVQNCQRSKTLQT